MSPVGSPDADHLRTLPVLYVEDDPSIREELASFLRRRVGPLRTAADGEEGLAAFREAAPRIVVSDIQMPRLDGLGMVRGIRAVDPEVPVILTTAFERPDLMTTAIHLRVDAYVVKPIDGDALEAALLACARRDRLEAEARRMREMAFEVERLTRQSALRLLLGGIAHDYNNLLQGILTSMFSARTMVPPGSRAREELDRGMRASKEARELSGRLEQIANPGELPDRTGDVSDLLRDTAGEALAGSPCTAEVVFEGGPCPIPYNARGLAQVFRELAVNAREAMPAGGVLRIRGARGRFPGDSPAGPAPGPCLHLAFTDEGPGIPPDLLPRIFDPYFSTKDDYARRGLGLGLAVSQAIVLGHRGTLAAASEVGIGTTLHLRLPMAGEG